jgi:hypothetical protein
MILTKAQIDEYERIAYFARDEAAVVAITDLVKHYLKKAQDEMLLAVESRQLRQLQGEAGAYQRLLKSLTVPPRATPQG